MLYKHLTLVTRLYPSILTALRNHIAAIGYSAAWLALVIGCVIYAGTIVELAVLLAIKL